MASAAVAGDGQAAARGRRLFETGIGRDGHAVAASFTESATPVPATLLSCAGCHGKDGKGRSAGGVDPPDITWQTLTKPYALRIGGRRIRQPYTEPLVIRAVMLGRDPDGRPLGAAMPRFRLSPGDATDLIAYLRELGSMSDPGIGADSLAIGILLPPPQHGATVQAAIRTVLGAYRDELNREGGIFGRRVEFSYIEADPGAGGERSRARAVAVEQAVVAVVAGGDLRGESHLARMAQQQGLPLVAARADGDPSPPRPIFYLSAGAAGEAAALALQAARELDAARSRLAVLYRDDDEGRGLMESLRPLIGRGGWLAVTEVRLPAAGLDGQNFSDALRPVAGDDALLVATPDAGTARLLTGVENADRKRLILLPGSATQPEWLLADAGEQTRILLGFELAGLPPAEARGYRAFARRPGPFEPELQEHDALLAAAKLLLEGLRRAGRNVTRAKLIEAIESIQRFETGALPPLSYGPRRHVGIAGARVVPFDPLRRRLMDPIGRIVVD